MSSRTSNSNNVTFDCHKTLADVLNFFNNGNIRDCRALIRSLKHKDIVISHNKLLVKLLKSTNDVILFLLLSTFVIILEHVQCHIMTSEVTSRLMHQ